MVNRRAYLLLDPPSTAAFSRRSSLREKDNASNAIFPSIDLILLSGVVREAGFEPMFVDAQIDRLSWSELTRRLQQFDLAGIVTLTSSSRIDEELAALRRLREDLGGVSCYLVGTILLQLEAGRVRGILESNPWLDGIILNTTENNFGDLIAAEVSRDVEPVNVAVRRRLHRHNDASSPDGEKAVCVPPVKVRYGDSLRVPHPEHAIFKDGRYSFPQSKRGPVTCTQLSFGCPFTCEFCVDNRQYRKMLYRDVDDVIEELVDVDRNGFREVYFKDLTFGLNKKITTEFLEKLIAKRLGLRFLCTTRIDVATPELLYLMRRAGCYGIEFGVEHAKQSVRARVDKPISDADIHDVFKRCRKLGIETTAFVMLAFEDDTEEDVRDTIAFARLLDADYVSFNVVNALPGTAFEARARREGFLLEEASDYGFVRSNIRHKHLTPERIEALYREAVRSFYFRPRQMARRILGLRSMFELKKLVRLGQAAF